MLYIRSGAFTPVTPGPPTPTPSGADGLGELYNCMYGGTYSDIFGNQVGYGYDYEHSVSSTPWAAPDGGRGRGYSAGQVDWEDSATPQTWPVSPGPVGPFTDSSGDPRPLSWSDRKCIDTWWHSDLAPGGTSLVENRAFFDITQFTVHGRNSDGTWTLVPAPSPTDVTQWVSWIQPVFNFMPDSVNWSWQTEGSTGFYRNDMSASTVSNNYLLHGASNQFFPRADMSPYNAISLQAWARCTPFAGIDPNSIYMRAWCGSDLYLNTQDSGGPDNGAIGTARPRRLPTDQSWRKLGYVTLSPADLVATPPPLIAYPS